MDNSKLIQNMLQEIKRGSIVLAVLLMTERPAYGYLLVTQLQEKGFPIEQNTLYPLLRRLENQGLVESTWDTEKNRPRKYYQRTDTGKEVVKQLKKEWQKIHNAILSI